MTLVGARPRVLKPQNLRVWTKIFWGPRLGVNSAVGEVAVRGAGSLVGGAHPTCTHWLQATSGTQHHQNGGTLGPLGSATRQRTKRDDPDSLERDWMDGRGWV